ncbi:MAG: putative DNA binding domain-containing protein [Propionibacterium sp.]|nr:putative DNA binding domain-containing protein [Propionibacterium sp.]
MSADITSALDAIWGGSTADAQESAVLEFKTVGRSIVDTLTDLAEAAACFANAQGGSLVVGVRDRQPGAEAFVGASQLDPAQTVGRIYEVTEPGLIVIADVRDYRGVQLLEITVPRSPDIHQVAGKATERVGKSCRAMNAARIAALLADRRGDDWSSKDSGVSPDSVGPVVQATVRERLARSSSMERNSWAQLPWPDICRRIGAMGEATLNNAGWALLADSEHVQAQYVRRAANAGLLSANESVHGPGILAITRILDLVESRTERTAIVTPNGAQLLVGDLPETAVREAVVNAFMHRDYRSPEIIRVEHDGPTLRVTSPGGLVPGVTVDNILTVSSRCRNFTLAQAIRSLDLAESAGVGVDRMYASMTAVGHQPPQFSTDLVTVTAFLRGGPPNEPVARFVADLPLERRGDPDTLLILTYLLTHRTTTAVHMAPLMQKPESETEARLLELSAPGMGLLERTADTAHSRRGEYRLVGSAIRALGPAVSYRTRSGDDSDRKIITIVSEMGSINGRIVQALFDVQPATASRILSDLVDRKILEKTSKAQRGPSVTYGPGKDFPRRPAREGKRATRGRSEQKLPMDVEEGGESNE